MLTIFGIFLILLTLPFIPSFFELKRPRDTKPLFIDLNYSKDVRYFGKSFRNIIGKTIEVLGISEENLDSDQIFEVNIKRGEKEKLEFSIKEEYIPESLEINHIVVAKNLKTKPFTTFNKEIYVRGNAKIGPFNTIRAIAVDGNLDLGRGTRIIRWADALGDVKVNDNCSLGLSLTSERSISLGRRVTFKRLFGKPVILASGFSKKRKREEIRNEINGSVKIDGRINLDMEEGLIINGNIFAEGDVSLRGDIEVNGDIFSQRKVILDGVKIGDEGKIKSVIGAEGVVLKSNILIYGQVLTEGIGKTE